MRNAVKRVLILMIAFVFMLAVFFFTKNILVGNAVFNLHESYSLGEQLQGSLTLSIGPGDMIPNDSEIIVRLTRGEEVLAERKFMAAEFLTSLDPVGIYNETSNETGFYFNQEGTYSKNILDFIDYTFTEPGNYTLEFSIPALGLDKAENFSVINDAEFSSSSFTQQMSITSPLNINYTINVSSISYSVSGDNLSVCWYSINSGVSNSTAVPAGTGFTGVNSAEGSNTWIVYCNDTDGAVNSSSVTFFKDTINPGINFTIGTEAANSLYKRNWIFVNVSASDSGSGLKNITIFLYNSTSLANFSSSTGSPFSYNFTSLPDEVYSINSTAYDNLGNSNSTETRTITIDNAPPRVTVVSPLAANYSSHAISFNVSLNKNSSCLFTLSNWAANYTMTRRNDTYSNYTNSTMSEGYHTAKFYCNDTLNNINSTANITFFIDYTPPLISYGSGTENDGTIFKRNWIYANVSVTEINEKNITFLLTQAGSLINSTTYVNAARFINWTNLTDGTYSYNVSIFDTSGNFNSTESRAVTLDTTPPNTNITFPQNTAYNWVNFTFNVSTNENSTCLYRLNDSSVNISMSSADNRSFNASNSSLVEKDYVAYFNCNDSLGNLNNSESVNFSIDRTAPVTSLITVNDAQSYVFNVSDRSPIANCSLILGGVSVSTKSFPSKDVSQIVSHPTDSGTYTYFINCTDIAGNTGNSSSATLVITSTSTTVYSAGGGGGTAIKYQSLKFVFPESVSVYRNNSIEIVFRLQNSGDNELQGINLTSAVKFNNALSGDLRLAFSKSLIDSLAPGESQNVTLAIFSNTNTAGRYKVSINADVSSPKFSDSGDFFIDVKQNNESEFGDVISFSERLLFDNPKCIELLEVVNEAEQSYLQGNVNDSLSKARGAVEACKMALSEEPAQKSGGIAGSVIYYTIGLSVITLAVWLGFYIYRKVKLNKLRKFRTRDKRY